MYAARITKEKHIPVNIKLCLFETCFKLSYIVKMIQLYINNEHCTSLEQLKCYIIMCAGKESNIFQELLEDARCGVISRWLMERDLHQMANQIDDLDTNLGDSEYYSKLSKIIVGTVIETLKTKFEECFNLEDIKYECNKDVLTIHAYFKVLSIINETYKISFHSGQDCESTNINPLLLNKTEGDIEEIIISLNINPGSKNLLIKADDQKIYEDVLYNISKHRKRYDSCFKVGNVEISKKGLLVNFTINMHVIKNVDHDYRIRIITGIGEYSLDFNTASTYSGKIVPISFSLLQNGNIGNVCIMVDGSIAYNQKAII